MIFILNSMIEHWILAIKQFVLTKKLLIIDKCLRTLCSMLTLILKFIAASYLKLK